ncbi:MAG TPA: DMT family transporter [Devosia sp.]|jgi:drug/metabolite transporter (DMT)-like permease|nr:DMT family transporter [Devosia sp.]
MSRPLATALLLLATMLWGFAFVAQKHAMESMGPLTFTAARYLLGGLLVLPLCLWESRSAGRPLRRGIVGASLALSVVFFMGTWLQQWGLETTTVTNAGFLTGLYVMFVPIIAFVALRHRPHPVLLFGVPTALVGIYLLNGASLDQLSSGDLLVIMCAGFWAVHILVLGILATRSARPISVSAITFLAAGTLSLGLALTFETPSLAALSEGWVAIAYAGIASTAIGFTLQAIGQQHVPPANAAIILSAESLFAALGGAIILGERLQPIGYLGAVLIFLAIIAVETVPPLLARRRAAARPEGYSV